MLQFEERVNWLDERKSLSFVEPGLRSSFDYNHYEVSPAHRITQQQEEDNLSAQLLSDWTFFSMTISEFNQSEQRSLTDSDRTSQPELDNISSNESQLSRSDSVQTSSSSLSSSSSSPSQKYGSVGAKGPERYKTELCRQYEDTGSCKYGDKCQFAHGIAELRSVTRHPKYKTDKCRTFYTTGFCSYGQRCHFIHKQRPWCHGAVAELSSGVVGDDGSTTRNTSYFSTNSTSSTQTSNLSVEDWHSNCSLDLTNSQSFPQTHGTHYHQQQQLGDITAAVSFLRVSPPSSSSSTVHSFHSSSSPSSISFPTPTSSTLQTLPGPIKSPHGENLRGVSRGSSSTIQRSLFVNHSPTGLERFTLLGGLTGLEGFTGLNGFTDFEKFNLQWNCRSGFGQQLRSDCPWSRNEKLHKLIAL